MIESLLLAVTRISTFAGTQGLTNATGFFFERDGRLFLVTNRHVAFDEPSGHRPDRFAIELHTNPDNVAEVAHFSIPLYAGTAPVWRETRDTAGIVDVVAIELDQRALPATRLLHAFTPRHLLANLDDVEVGEHVTIVGFPLGFHDTFHHLPVARQSVVASAFGIRFQGFGYFLTDARMHRGTSGAPVVTRPPDAGSGRGELRWILLGVHAARFDVEREPEHDERLDLNCAWYADVLLALTA
ncbi:MAG TPA: serine protease [Dokdonella sp.]